MTERETELKFIDYLLNKMKGERLSSEEYRALQYFLIKNSFFKRNDYPICETFMEEGKVLIISDTHIGSIYENRSFIDSVYNYAISSGIKTIIHTGDLIEGQSRVWDRSKNELESEIGYAISIIPKEVKTKLLFGNHDFSVFSAWGYVSLLDLFFKESNLDILGLGRVILNWNNIPILINHYISDKMIHFDNAITNEVVMLEGHSHLYFANPLNRVIKVPSLSDELKDSTYYEKINLAHFGYTLVTNHKPYLNFIQSTFLGNDILFKEMRQNSNGYIVPNEQVVLDVNGKTFRKL